MRWWWRWSTPKPAPCHALGIPVKLSATPGTIRRPAPLLGQHTDEILAELAMADVTLERRGVAAWLTFDRPEAHNAMTFAMYDRLVEHCETVDADDAIKVMVLRGAGGKAFVAGTDIRQFAEFKSAQDGLVYEARIDAVLDRLEAVRKPTIALVDGFAMGSGLAISAACDLRVITPDAKFGMPIARTVGNCLSMGNYARLAQALGAPRLKDLMFRARRSRPTRRSRSASRQRARPTTPRRT